MNRVRKLRSALSLLLLLALLCSTALAEGFNAKLDIVTTDTTITVTVQDSDVLEDQKPTLIVDCPFSYAEVTFGGTTVPSTLQDGKISFTVAKGGTYVITKTAKPAEPVAGAETPVKPAEKSWENPYADVEADQWFADAVEYVTKQGIMKGVSDTSFAPNVTVSRAMVWTVLARLDGENTEGGASWYTKAKDWAKKNGVSDGTDHNGTITREQLAAMLYRACGSPEVTGSLAAYPDGSDVSSWAEDAMLWATQKGIIGGMPDGTLSPKSGTTRAQLATILTRLAA